MKIIRVGKLSKNHDEYEGECRRCGCKVQCNKDELKEGYSGMDAEYGYFVMCPMEGCNRQIDMRKIVWR